MIQKVQPQVGQVAHEAVDGQLSSTALRLLPRLFRAQAYRELGAARLFEAGLRFAPDATSRARLAGHAAEERQHFAAVLILWSTFCQTPQELLQSQIDDRLRSVPLPAAEGWLDMAMARFLFDRAGYWQLREYTDCCFLPYRQLAMQIIAEEEAHTAVGMHAVDEAARACTPRAIRHAFERWLRPALLSFGRSGTPDSQAAIHARLKRRDPGTVMQDFIDDIRAGVEAAGLFFPSADALNLQLPTALRF